MLTGKHESVDTSPKCQSFNRCHKGIKWKKIEVFDVQDVQEVHI